MPPPDGMECHPDAHARCGRFEQSADAAKIECQQSADLRPFTVNWMQVTSRDAEEFDALVDGAQDEQPIQTFLEQRPWILAQYLRGGHGRWVIPRPSLGGRLVPDFLLCETSSLGPLWIGVELESPKAKVFRRDGGFASKVQQAIRQVQDWREWLKHNIDCARRSKRAQGLGLPGIDGDLRALIVVGRRSDFAEGGDARRRRAMIENHIEIRSYDFLIELVRGGAAFKEYDWDRLMREQLAPRARTMPPCPPS